MNRFKKLIDDMKQRAVTEGVEVAAPFVLPTQPEQPDGDERPYLRQPYSSEPDPIGDAWNE